MASTNNKDRLSGEITLIGVEFTSPQSRDRAGGEQHSRVGNAVRALIGRKINQEDFRKNLDAALEQLQGTLSNLTERAMKGWELESISVSLAVSTEGSIGIATVGTEASMEATFARKT